MTSMDHADRECARLQRSLSAGLRLPAVPSLGDFGDLFDALGAPTAHDDLAADPFGLADPFDFGAPPPTKAQQFDLQFGLARAHARGRGPGKGPKPARAFDDAGLRALGGLGCGKDEGPAYRRTALPPIHLGPLRGAPSPQASADTGKLSASTFLSAGPESPPPAAPQRPALERWPSARSSARSGPPDSPRAPPPAPPAFDFQPAAFQPAYAPEPPAPRGVCDVDAKLRAVRARRNIAAAGPGLNTADRTERAIRELQETVQHLKRSRHTFEAGNPPAVLQTAPAFRSLLARPDPLPPPKRARPAARTAAAPAYTGGEVLGCIKAVMAEIGSTQLGPDEYELLRQGRALELPGAPRRAFPSYETIALLFGSWARAVDYALASGDGAKAQKSAFLCGLRDCLAEKQ